MKHYVLISSENVNKINWKSMIDLLQDKLMHSEQKYIMEVWQMNWLNKNRNTNLVDL